MGINSTCPLCGLIIDGYPATSRLDNKTEICSECGLKEAACGRSHVLYKKLWSKAVDKSKRAEMIEHITIKSN